MKATPAERFWRHVTITDACWNYSPVNYHGYGRIGIDYRRHHAHRFSYEMHVGPIPDGLDIDHLCRNRACVNPDHLEPVTRQVNLLRGVGPTATNAAKEFCKRGHEFTPENTMIRKEGWRNCRACHYERRNARKSRIISERRLP
jgi:hypothetical protein